MRWNLRNKFLLPTLGAIVLGMVIATYISYSTSANALRHMVEEQLSQISSSMAKQIDTWLIDLKADTEQLSRQKVFASVLEDKNSVTEINATLESIKNRYGVYEFLGITDSKGLTIACSIPSQVGVLNVKDRSYFKDALKGKTVISEVVKSKVSGNPIFVIASPIKVDGQIKGMFFSVVDLAIFNSNFIDPIKIGDRGYAYIMQENGVIISYPIKEKILDLDLSAYDFGDEMLKIKNGYQVYEWKGATKMVAFNQVPSTKWIIAAGAELQDIFSPIYAMRSQSILVAVLMLIAVGIVIFVIVKSIVDAMKKGISFAEQISIGDLSSRLRMVRNDELGDLAKSLDSMTDTLEKKAKLATIIAEGDLTYDVELASDKDSLGKALQTMSESLKNLISEIQESGSQIASGSAQVSDASQSLSQGATESAASLEEISSSMTEMTGQIRQSAENASQANSLSVSAKESAEKGNVQMQHMVEAMNGIQESSQHIAKIIKVIDDIAFQTNLLALNAAVEAARAGRHGKGFAVVADEVRNLASRSAKAAKETAEMIESAIKKVENGTDIAQFTAEALTEIVSNVTKATDLVGEISSASNEQAQGITQANEALTQIDQVTQQNTANAEETASAAEELSSQAAQLQAMLKRFKVDSSGRTRKDLPMVEQRDAGTKKTAQLGTAGTWGYHVAKGSDGVVKPHEIIALDDNEFGKY